MNRAEQPKWRKSLPGILDRIEEKLDVALSNGQDEIDSKLRQLIEELGDPSASLIEEMEDVPTSGFERLNCYAPPRTTPVGDSSELQGPKAILEDFLQNRERTAFALGHRSASSKRGWVDLPGNLKEKHRDQFVGLTLEVFAGLRVPKASQFRDLRLNILIVDNKPDEIRLYDELLPPELGLVFWRNCAPWVYRVEGSEALKQLQRDVRHDHFSNSRLTSIDGFPGSRVDPDQVPRPREFDLILQDEFLQAEVDGLELSELYFEYMPQALVFLTTGLEVANVTSLTHSPSVDRILPKNRLAALPWYYYIAFTDILGQMFWPSWLAEEKGGGLPYLERRATLRRLLGTIRRWLREPEILWHGQALAEMVDHGHEHISDLWELTREILGATDNEGNLLIGLDKVTTAERVLVALGVWLHDVGHRGDEFCTSPEDIRNVHGSISERLLLEDPSAFGLDWMLDGAHPWSRDGESRDGDSAEERLKLRNHLPESGTLIGQSGTELHPLRAAGLLCRHHQSSAPLFRGSLSSLHFKLKFPSDYARVSYGSETDSDAEDDLVSWRNEEKDLDWKGFSIRTLEDFSDCLAGIDLLKCGCLLRLFDGVNLTKRRAGSRYRLATHRQYRRQRCGWVSRKLQSLRKELTTSPVGSLSYLRRLDEILALESYRDLLDVQDVHLWRQQAVDSWSVTSNGEEIEVTYQIMVPTTIWEDTRFVPFRKALIDHYGGDGKASWYTEDEQTTWRANFLDDCVSSEVEAQKPPDATAEAETYLAGNVFSEVDLIFRVRSHESRATRVYSLKAGNLENDEQGLSQ